MPNWRLTLALTAVFVALALYTYFLEMRKTEPLPGDEKTVPVWNLDEKQRKAFTHLELTVGATRAVIAHNNKDEWWMTEPKPQKLDATRLDYMLNNLRDLRAERIIEDKETKLSDYGLDKPAFRITLADKERKPLYELAGGGQSPTKSGYYVQKKGEPKIYLVATWRLDDVKRLITEPPTPPPTPRPTPTPVPTRPPTSTPRATASAEPSPATPATKGRTPAPRASVSVRPSPSR